MFAGVLPRNCETSIPAESSAVTGRRLNSEGAAPGAAFRLLRSSSAAQLRRARPSLIRLESRSFRSASRSISRTRSPDRPSTLPVSRRRQRLPVLQAVAQRHARDARARRAPGRRRRRSPRGAAASSTSLNAASESTSSIRSPSSVSSPTGRLQGQRLTAAHLGQVVDLLHRGVERLRQLLAARLATHRLRELEPRAVQLAQPVVDVHRKADRTRAIGDRTRDALADPPRGVRGELEAAAPVEQLDRAHQADVAFLDQVEQRKSLALVLAGHGHHQPEVGHDESLARRLGVSDVAAGLRDALLRTQAAGPEAILGLLARSRWSWRARPLPPWSAAARGPPPRGRGEDRLRRRSLGDALVQALRITAPPRDPLHRTARHARSSRKSGHPSRAAWCGQAHVGQTPWPLVFHGRSWSYFCKAQPVCTGVEVV